MLVTSSTGHSPILIHAHWRSSSTYFLNKFRLVSDNTYCYWEPYHEFLYTLTPSLAASLGPLSWNSGHDHPELPYFTEYVPLLSNGKGVAKYKLEFTYLRAFPTGTLPEDEQQYIGSLIDFAQKQHKIPVLGFCHSLARAGQLRSAFQGIHICQYTNPHQILQSYIPAGTLRFFLENLSAYPADSLPAQLDMHRPETAIALHNQRALRHLADYTPEVIAAFFDFFVVTTIAAAFYSDILVDISRLAHDLDYRKQIESDIHKKTQCPIVFDDIMCPPADELPVFDPRLLEQSIERHIGTRSRIEHFKNTLESISGADVVRTVDDIEQMREGFITRYPSSSNTDHLSRALDTHNELEQHMAKHSIQAYLDLHHRLPAYQQTIHEAAQRLKGQDVYFWGGGELYHANKHLFAECNPKAILIEPLNGELPEQIDGIRVCPPAEVLLSGEALPIIVFVQDVTGISQRIRIRFPQCTDVVFCHTAIPS